MANKKINQPGRATIADVAALAEVSIKTVSRVFNKEPNVREDTREKVLEAIATLSYRPDPSARSLAGRRSFLIGLLYDNPSASYLVELQSGALTTSHAHGYDLIIHPCDYTSGDLSSDIASMITSTKVDGLILTPPLSDMKALIRMLDARSVPSVRIAPANSSEKFRSVHTNDRESCAQLTGYLIELGHERIGFIIGHPDHKAVGNRYRGYQDGLNSNGVALRQRLVVQGYNSFESGMECARKLLSRKRPPTAIFASNDDMAAGVMRVAHERGISIPGELSVAGFDDIPLASQIWPALTTIRQPIRDMARLATERLVALLRREELSGEMQSIPSRLIVRDSTGPAPGFSGKR